MREIKISKPQIIFVVATIFVYLFGLGRLPLVGPDEPRYAEVAREMFERNDFITPTLGGFDWFEKPALLYWLEIAAYNVFGVNEFAARFGSAIFGLLTILTVYLLCRFAANNDQRTTNNLPFYAFLTTASSIGLLVFSRAASFDIILTFPFAAALTCFFVFDSCERRGSKSVLYLAGFYFFIGVALLAKGLIGAVLPFGIVFCYFAAVRKLPSKTLLLSLIWGNLLSALVAAVWYVPMYLRHGWTFIDEFFVQHHFARYTSNKFSHPEPFWFFWAILPAMILPWTPFLLVAIWRFFKERRTTNDEQRTIKTFALVWLLVPLAFFTFSGSKLPGYILPALPAAAILAAFEVARFAAKSDARRYLTQSLAAFAFAFVLVALFFVAPDFARRDTKKYLIEAATERGFATEKVLNLHDISHSLEFYAANRNVRLENGKLRQFFGAGDIWNFMNQTGEQRVLVVVPLSRLHELPEFDRFKTEIIADNGEYAIAAVSL